MLVENLLYTLINKGDIETLYKLKDKFFKQNDAEYVLFVQDFYSQYNKLPDINTVESKFNISLIPNNEKPAYWYKEVIKKYQEYVIEQAIISSAKQKNNAVDIFQKALIDYNSELDVDVIDYSDAKRRIQSYNALKLNKGVSYLPTGNDEFDVFSSGYKRADLWTIGGHEGAGKAQPLSEKILGENGWTTMGKLSVGDNIYGSDGHLQKVVEIYPQGVRPIYTITFADKTSVRCDLEHLWSVEDCNDRSKNRGFKTLTTKELKDSIDSGIKKYYRLTAFFLMLLLFTACAEKTSLKNNSQFSGNNASSKAPVDIYWWKHNTSRFKFSGGGILEKWEMDNSVQRIFRGNIACRKRE